MSKLIAIAKRQHRKEVADHKIVDLLRLADQLEIEILPGNLTADEVLERAKKEHQRDVGRARRAAFRMLLAGRQRNRHDCAERGVLFNEIVSTILAEYPSWETTYTSTLANTARIQFDLAMAVQPVERIMDASDR